VLHGREEALHCQRSAGASAGRDLEPPSLRGFHVDVVITRSISSAVTLQNDRWERGERRFTVVLFGFVTFGV